MELIAYIENHQPIATILTGLFAVIAVVASQIWLDARQRRDHRHSYEIKANELLLEKKEKLIELISEQIRSISEVGDIFYSWQEDFAKNYSHFRINAVLREIDTKLDKIHLLVKEYFPSFIHYVDKVEVESQPFHETCADFSMAAKFGETDFLNLDFIEIVEICNSYAVAYMQVSRLLVDRKESKNPFSRLT